MSSAKHLSPPSPPPSRPTQASKSNSDSLKANIAKERYTSSPDTLKMKQKARTVAIPGLPTNLAYPPKIKANGPGKPKSSSSKKKPSPSRKKGSPLDSIDKLDITGMYGQGSFHHDGPFDACRPHRNKRTSRAPVAAFPVNGPNNTLDGVDYRRGNQNTENRIMGRADNEALRSSRWVYHKRSSKKFNRPSRLFAIIAAGLTRQWRAVLSMETPLWDLEHQPFLKVRQRQNLSRPTRQRRISSPCSSKIKLSAKSQLCRGCAEMRNSNGSVAEKVRKNGLPLPPTHCHRFRRRQYSYPASVISIPHHNSRFLLHRLEATAFCGAWKVSKWLQIGAAGRSPIQLCKNCALPLVFVASDYYGVEWRWLCDVFDYYYKWIDFL